MSIDVREYRPQINPRLADAIYSCIEPDVAKRCPSIERFLYAIRKIKHEDGK